MTLYEFEQGWLYDFDTEYRECVADYTMARGWIDGAPIDIRYRGTPRQRDALEDAYKQPLTHDLLDFVTDRMAGDPQLARFEATYMEAVS